MKKIIAIIILVALFTFGVSALESTSCDEPGHFIDRSGNAYCSSEEPVFDFFATDNRVCLWDTGV